MSDYTQRMRKAAETDTIRPDESAKIRALHPDCYFPVCFCRDGCQFRRNLTDAPIGSKPDAPNTDENEGR